jgi:hypothetical protein
VLFLPYPDTVEQIFYKTSLKFTPKLKKTHPEKINTPVRKIVSILIGEIVL